MSETSVKSEAASPTEAAASRLRAAKAENLNLDLTRGKPSPEQLDLSMGLLEHLSGPELAGHSPDLRNYGGLEGLPEARALFAEYLGTEVEETWVQGNSSLRLMFDVATWCQFLGTSTGAPWSQQNDPELSPIFLCPTPGYDRHFHLLDHLGIEMEAVPLHDSGPDLELVQERVARDPRVKGMFCVPRFSNPSGVVYSDETVETLASMPCAASDFRVFWDNAYAHHELVPGAPELRPFLECCKTAGNPERAFIFGSTSKITLAGAGVSLIAVAGSNQRWLKDHLQKQTIGPNKLVQFAHIRYFQDLAAIKRHMAGHAALLQPKFEAALDVLESRLGSLGVASWTFPKGGYFISVDTAEGCASRAVELAAAVGVKLTPAGATTPYGKDPLDSNLRLAPSFPSVADVRRSTEILADCILVAASELRSA